MKLEIDQKAVKGLIKNSMDLDVYYIPKVEASKRLGIKVCSICAGKGHSWKNCIKVT